VSSHTQQHSVTTEEEKVEAEAKAKADEEDGGGETDHLHHRQQH